MKTKSKFTILLMIFILFFTSLANANDFSEEDTLYNVAMEEENISLQTKLFIKGYTQYSDHDKFVKFMVNNIDRVMNWSKSQYDIQNYEDAILGYNSIINLVERESELKLNIDIEELTVLIGQAQEQLEQLDKKSTSEENYVDEAQAEGEVISEESIEENQGLKEINDVKKDKEVETEVQSGKKTDVPTLEQILELGKNEYTASGKRKIYMEGYELYPESQEIKERLESTAKGLLNLGKNHHLKGNFNSAINYYDDILTMPEISQGTIGLAERYRDVANKGIVYRSLEEILELGKNEYTASGKRKIYMEGYELYPESQEIKERLESTAKGLLNLGKNHHSKGNFNSAINYYNDILTMPGVSQGTIGLVEKYKGLANEGTILKTLEEILELGKNEYTASGKRKIYMEGYELYPESEEIKERLENAAKGLLNLGKNHHSKGNFNSAINYYNDILTMPEISQGTIGLAERYRDVANKEIVYRSLEEILELGKNEYTASGKRKIYMEGYELYPESEEIKERLENTAKGLLNLGRTYHSKGNFNSAINYYNNILTMSGVSQETIGLAEKYKGLANEGTILKTLEEILELGKNEYTASGKRKIYMEGYELYPESEEIKERLENTAKGLLNLGKNHHSKGNFNSAINYYNDILTMPEISNNITFLVKTYLDLAQENSLFNTEKEILELGKNEYTASGKRKIYIVGYDLYPESQEIKERLEYTAKGLLNLGKNHHLKGNFNSAINYYNDILTMPGISNHIKNEAFTLLNFAKDNKPYKSLLGKTIMLDPGHGGIDPGAVNNYLGLYEKNFNNGLTIRIANKLRELGANVIFTREPGEDKYIGLHDRTVIVNKRNPDLFLSIHHDSSTNKSTTGMSVHYSTYRPGLDTVGTYVEYNGRVYPFIREIKEWSDPVRKTTDPGIVILYNGQEKIVNIKDTMVYDDRSPTNVAVKSEKFANYLFKSLLEADYKNGYNYIKDHNLHVTRWTNVPSALIEAGYISNNNEALRVINPNVQDKIAQKVVEATKEYFK